MLTAKGEIKAVIKTKELPTTSLIVGNVDLSNIATGFALTQKAGEVPVLMIECHVSSVEFDGIVGEIELKNND